MELAGLEVALGESVSECEGLGHYCRLYEHCTLGLHEIYKNYFSFFNNKLTLADCNFCGL
jgi:hypothetical protein